MVGICKAADACSAYKSGKCLGCDCDCIILGTDEADMLKELGYGDQFDWDERGWD
jgi:hypothetical protein